MDLQKQPTEADPEIPLGVCSTCYNLDLTLLLQLKLPRQLTVGSWDMLVDGLDVQSSAGNGCEFCSCILSGLSHHLLETGAWRLSEKSLKETLRFKFYPSYGFVVEVTGIHSRDDTVEFYTETGDVPASPAFGFGNRVPTTLDADVCVKMLQPLIATCFHHHLDCKNTRSLPLPGRLLDLERFQEGYIKLVPTLGMEQPKYVALSHCWGQAQAMTTISSNLESYSKQIPIERIPKTFFEAALITLGLRSRYLWIDSLCIVQNNAADWEMESKKMASVYGSSYLTIAVLQSPDNHGGCFSPRYQSSSSTSHDSPFRFCPTDSIPVKFRRGDANLTVMTRPVLWKTHLHHARGDATVEETPLLTRAWAFQERLLASRTLLIYPGELVWECRTTTACECGAIHKPVQNKIEGVGGLLKESIQASNNATPTEAILNWYRLVSRYSSLGLTKSSDSLPALSGLAEHFSPFAMGDYMYGLWSVDFPRNLLWTSFYRKENHKHQALRRRYFRKRPPAWLNASKAKGLAEIPSWSWAALCFEPMAEVTAIMFRDDLLKGDFTADSRLRFFPITSQALPSSISENDSRKILRLSGATIEERYHKYDTKNNIFRKATLHFDGKRGLEDGKMLTCLLFGSSFPGDWAWGPEYSNYYMILLRSVNVQERLFRRVGTMTITLKVGTIVKDGNCSPWFDNVDATTVNII